MSQPTELSTPPAPANFKLHRRFDRAARLLGESGMARLGRAHVAVVGLGGVGSFAAEALARSGVGALTLIDFDRVCVTNTNRQLHALQGAVGKSKAERMAERVRQINPLAQVQAVEAFYGAETAEALVPPGRFDHLVDAIDNVQAKLHLLARCQALSLPVISTLGAAGRLDPTLIRVCDLAETHSDPFARDVRRLLRARHGIDTSQRTGIQTVFSLEPHREPEPVSFDADGFQCVCPQSENDLHTCERRSQIDGSAAFVTGAFGLTAAGVVVRAIASRVR